MLAEQLARELWTNARVLPTWLPDRRVSVGDIVAHTSGELVRVGTINELLESRSQPPIKVSSVGAPSKFVAHAGVQVSASVEGGASAARASISLKSSSSFVFVANFARHKSCERMAAESSIRFLSSLAAWRNEWRLVTDVREASAMSVIIADGGAVTAISSVSAGSAPGLGALQAGSEFSVTSGRAVSVSQGTCTPAYRAVGLKRRVFRPDEISEERSGQRTGGPREHTPDGIHDCDPNSMGF
jgi:hypothetical protein